MHNANSHIIHQTLLFDPNIYLEPYFDNIQRRHEEGHHQGTRPRRYHLLYCSW